MLNLFDEKNVIGRVETVSTRGITPADLGYPSGTDPIVYEGEYQTRNTTSVITPILNANPNILFNLPSAFQGPRNVRFGFKMQF